MMMNFDDMRRNTLEKVIEKQIEAAYSQAFNMKGWTEEAVENTLNEKLKDIERFYEKHIEES